MVCRVYFMQYNEHLDDILYRNRIDAKAYARQQGNSTYWLVDRRLVKYLTPRPIVTTCGNSDLERIRLRVSVRSRTMLVPTLLL
jgi:hypothetical protein